jgi:hypothetical protein
MSYVVNAVEFAVVTALPGPGRYEYFIHKVADAEAVWSLGSAEGWVLVGDADGRECVPVWSHSRYAAAYARGDWAGTEPRSIELSDWMEKWLPGIERDGRLVAVFPVPSGGGVVVPAERLRGDLEEELDKY